MKTIKLKYPITIDGEDITELNMRRAKVRDQLAVQNGANDAEQEVKLFANLCEVKADVITELDIADYHLLQETYTSFLS